MVPSCAPMSPAVEAESVALMPSSLAVTVVVPPVRLMFLASRPSTDWATVVVPPLITIAVQASMPSSPEFIVTLPSAMLT